MLKKSRKKVGKPTGEKTKAGRPIYIDDDTGERRSEYSSTIQLDNGKWINIPSIHNGHYYSDKELKEAVEDNRMIPTSEHKSEKEALLAAKKRSKNLKQGGLLKAHQGTIVYNEPDTGPVEAPQVNRDIGITRPRNTAVPTEPPVTDTAPAPTPIAPAPTPAILSPTVEPAVMPTGGPVEPAIEDITVDDDPTVAAEPTQTLPDPIQSVINLPMPDPMQTRPEVSFPQPLPREFTKIPTPQPFMPMPRTQPYRPRGIRPYNPFPSPSRNPFMRRPMPYNPYGQFPRRQLLGRGMDRRLSDLINNANRRASRGGLKPNTMPGYLNEMMQNLIRNNNTYRPRGFGNSIGRSMGYNEGGAVMEDQMKFFMEGGTPQEKQLSFFDEGGMKDDGGKKDPVSGNDVPIGSLDQEVRDDIPAMVSEGEFIFPADVTRYIGLDKLMQLRQDAKMGLKKMEMMGQLGNPEDAVLPDDIPFDAADIIIVDDEIEEEEESAEEKYQGGVTGFQKGTADPSQSYYNITEEANKPYNKKYVVYENDAGKTVLILSTFNGDPLESVPAGYKIVLNPDGSPATSMPERKDKDDDKDKDEDTSVQQNKDDNDTTDPMEHIRRSRESATVTAKRLGMDVDEYLALPMKTRFNLIGEELKVMRGAEPDLEKIEGIINGTITSGSGDGIFGFSLLGGILDTIGTVLDRDGNGSMWSSTVLNPDGTGKEIDIFGNTIRTFTKKEMKAFGNLVGGRWQGNLENPYSPKGSGRSGGDGLGGDDPTPTSSTAKYDDLTRMREATDAEKKGAYSRVSKDYTGAITNKGMQDEAQRQMAQARVNASKEAKKGYTGSRDDDDFHEQFSKTADVATPTEQATMGSGRNVTGDQKSETQADLSKAYGGSDDGNLAAGKFGGSKGTLITKRTKKKQPTKRKTLLKKRS